MPGIIDLPKFNYERRFGRNCCRWTRFIWNLLVTQVVTYIRTTPTPLLLLFIPNKFLVRMMIYKVQNNETKRKSGGHDKTAATKRLSLFLSIKAYVKRSDVAFY